MASNFGAWWDMISGVGGVDFGSLYLDYLGTASGRVFGTNPPYAINDFIAMYPKFFGPPATITGDTTTGSLIVSSLSSVVGLAAGQLVTGAGIPAGTVLASVDSSGSATLSAAAKATAAGVSLSVYTTPPVPLAVIQIYLNLAATSLSQARWGNTWQLAMALFIAHYLTLYATSDGAQAGANGQLAASGLDMGIVVSRTVGDVSASAQLVDYGAVWGTFNKTLYGTQLITLAGGIAHGPIYVG